MNCIGKLKTTINISALIDDETRLAEVYNIKIDRYHEQITIIEIPLIGDFGLKMLNLSLSNYNKVNFNTNILYYGDNLDILRHFIPTESIDLIYLDPPFNSQADYNVLFKESSGEKSTAQIQAFTDFWRWDAEARKAYEQLAARSFNETVSKLAQALYDFLGKTDMLAYLVMMGVRLFELHRVLKSTGSLFLHCDTTASHHLKLLMDSIFGVKNFRNEIIWKRTHAHSGAHRFGPIHDTILFYSKSDEYLWIPQQTPYSDDYLKNFFKFQDPDGRQYRATILTGSGISLIVNRTKVNTLEH